MSTPSYILAQHYSNHTRSASRPQSAADARSKLRAETMSQHLQRSQNISLEAELSHAQALLSVAEIEKRELRARVHQLSEQVDAMHRYAKDRMAAKHLIAWNTQVRKRENDTACRSAPPASDRLEPRSMCSAFFLSPPCVYLCSVVACSQDRVRTIEKMERMEERMEKLEKENALFRLRLREAGLPEK